MSADVCAAMPVVVLEVGYGRQQAYVAAHIPGALYLDTMEIEAPPLWNYRPVPELRAVLARLGLSTLTSKRTNSDKAADGENCIDVTALSTGAIPLWRMHIATTSDIEGYIASGEAQLVSIRSLNEYQGLTSGYPDIQHRGELPGAVWGGGGSDAMHLEDFLDDAGRLHPIRSILDMWRRNGLDLDRPLVFYCGTGWRASVAFFVAWLCCWPAISVYDGGWLEWSTLHPTPL
jgi:thiosulfate/3-mercaptopyruvate sulfurtransferase